MQQQALVLGIRLDTARRTRCLRWLNEASLHLLTQREVRRIISLYERVFREFRFVD